jgi:hypothetical protein
MKKFDGKGLEFQQGGDFLLSKIKKFSIHTRTKPWARAFVNTKFAVRVAGNVIVSQGDFSKIRLNGRIINLKNGRLALSKKSYLIRSNNKLTIVAGRLAQADFFFNKGNKWPQPHYYNIFVRSQYAGRARGLCKGQIVKAGGLFSKKFRPIIKKRVAKKCAKKRQYRRWCRKNTGSKRARRNCVFDLCAGVANKKQIKRLTKQEKKEKRKVKKSNKKIQKKKRAQKKAVRKAKREEKRRVRRANREQKRANRNAKKANKK